VLENKHKEDKPMLVVLTNPEGALLSEARYLIEGERTALNEQLRTEKALSRWVQADADGIPNKAALHKAFIWRSALGKPRHYKKRIIVRKGRVVEQKKDEHYFLVVRNPDKATFALILPDNKEDALEQVKKRLGTEMVVIVGHRLDIKVELE
jgi:hypothetical protein